MENGLLGFAGQGPAVDLDPNTQLFISSGIWTKPADCQWVRIIIVGGGQGGGGGQKGAASVAGGGGGAGGGMSFIDVPAGLLPSTVPVTIGAGGSGGAGATTSGGATGGGTSGGTTTFGDILSAEGGGVGGRGHFQGGNAGGSFFGGAGVTSLLITAGGGNGGQPTGHGADIGLGPAAAAAMTRSPFMEPQKFGVLGQGGHGGGYNLFGVAIHGVGVGTFGCGGGGGGASRLLGNGQDGARGGDGYCLVVSYGTQTRPVNVQEFTTDGTWTKPTDPRLSQARVFVIGGGGGGGSGRRWNYLNGAYLTGSYLALSSNANAYASAADSAALSITGDIDIMAKVAVHSWSEGDRAMFDQNITTRMVVSKWATAGNQRSYYLALTSRGEVSLGWSDNGTTQLATTSDAFITLESMVVKWVRATMDVNNGSGSRVTKFYTSDDGTTWTQLGSTITTAGATSIFDSTTSLSVGVITAGVSGNTIEGSIYRTTIKNGYDGAGSVVFDADFETATAGATTFTESSTNAVTVTITNAVTSVSGGGGGAGGGVSYSEIPLSVLPSTQEVTVGLGGTGGAGVTTDYRMGNHGGYGGNSSFGDYVSAMGGFRGHGGTCTLGGTHTSRVGNIFGYNYIGYVMGTLTGGGVGGTGAPGAATARDVSGYSGNFMTSGGGGGAGISTGGATGAGAVSQKSLGYGTIQINTPSSTDGAAVFPNASGMFGASGGGGGSSNGTVNAGNGVRGSGGGGGAGTTTGTISGAGGNGGDGYVLVVCV